MFEEETRAVIANLRLALSRADGSVFAQTAIVSRGDLQSCIDRLEYIVDRPTDAIRKVLVERMCKAYQTRYLSGDYLAGLAPNTSAEQRAASWPGTVNMEAALDQLLSDLLIPKVPK